MTHRRDSGLRRDDDSIKNDHAPDCTESTIYRMVSQCPDRLPPRVATLGRPRWLPAVAREWAMVNSDRSPGRARASSNREKMARATVSVVARFERLTEFSVCQIVPRPLKILVFKENWCGREDSNFHGLSATTTSTLRVYQFRHDRTTCWAGRVRHRVGAGA